MSEKQPQTNDYRKRIARPLYSRSFSATNASEADRDANDYSDLVSDMGGEVQDIRPYATHSTIHYRVVTYRAAIRIQEST